MTTKPTLGRATFGVTLPKIASQQLLKRKVAGVW